MIIHCAEFNAKTVIPDANQSYPYPNIRQAKIQAFETVITFKLGNLLQLNCSAVIQVERMILKVK